MASYQANLITAKEQVAARLVELTASPKPSYSVDGQSVSWESYFATLTNQLQALEQAIQRADGPFEVRTQGVT